MIRPQFTNNEIYHVYNRGVDKRDIFMEKADYIRFIHDLFEFNDIKPAPPSNIRLCLRKPSEFTTKKQCLEVQPPNIQEKEPRKLLVKILAWCLISNHYHLLIRQIRDNGIVRFMQKLGTGYTMYFNEKEERVGSLFQGRFKAVIIKNENHFMYLPFYIHCNALDLIEPEWRNGRINDFKKVIEFLKKYRYSSYLDYMGEKNFPSISQREFILNIFGGTENYKKQQLNWLKQMTKNSMEELEGFLLD